MVAPHLAQGASQIEQTDKSNQQAEVVQQITEFTPLGRKIYTAAIRDKWDEVSHIFEADKQKLKVKISYEGETALCVAVGTNRSHNFVESIVQKIMTTDGWKETLRIKNGENGENALNVAARLGNIKAARLLVSKDRELPQIFSGFNTPLTNAAMSNDVETLEYLLTVTRDVVDADGKSPYQGTAGDFLLCRCIYANHFHVALYLVRNYPFLVYQMHDTNEEIKALQYLASKPDAFRSGTNLGIFESIIYSAISINEASLGYSLPVNATGAAAAAAATTTQNDPRESTALEEVIVTGGSRAAQGNRVAGAGAGAGPSNAAKGSHQNIIRTEMSNASRSSESTNSLFQKCLLKVPGVKKIHDMKVKHKQAEQLVKEICSVILDQNESVVYHVLGPAIRTAVRYGCHELIEECLLRDPGLLWYRDDNDESSFFELAIKHRQEKVFNLIYQVSAHRMTPLGRTADNGNTLLHVAGKLPPYHRLTTVTGAALQMQRELQWFQEVKKFIKASKLELYENDNRDTPQMVFNEEHKQLLEDAQKWTKGTSTSSTVVAALVVTMTFSAMFNVPGGNQTDGYSPFKTQGVFLLFVASDAIALFSAATSVLMFLSTLTHSSQDDFLYDLPLRLVLGLLSLFISILATMIAFSAALVIAIRDEVDTYQVAVPVTVLAGIPAILYLWLQLPLLRELIGATMGRSIFRKQNDFLLH